MATALCCLGEIKKRASIPRVQQIAGYLCISTTISMKIWWLRYIFALICWISTIYSITFATIVWNSSHAHNLLLWFFYYTHWTMLCQCFYWSIVLYLHRKIYSSHDQPDQQETPINSWLFYVMKITNIFGVSAGLGLTIVFWTAIWDGPSIYPGADVPYVIDNVFKHGINAILILVDFYLSQSIYRYKDIWILMLYAMSYQLFNLIYVLLGGKDDSGNNYLYSIYDWNNDPTGAAIQVGIFVAAHAIGYLLGAFIKKIILYRYLVHRTDLNVSKAVEISKY